jgi:cyclic pyranopterin phosphate synthase
MAEHQPRLTHLDEAGRPRMVDVGAKAVTERVATAAGEIRMQPATLEAIAGGAIAKGDVLGVAQTAAIMAAKRTWELIPMCHPLMLTGVAPEFAVDRDRSAIELRVTVKTSGKTGVEMEALTAVATGLLTVYDMCKAIDRGMAIGDVRLLHKAGGKSGTWRRSDGPRP